MARYGTVAGYKAYEAARGRTVTAADEEIEAAGLVASEALDGRYAAAFPGLKTGGRDQVRSWPRIGVQDSEGYAVPSDTVPVEIDNASYELTRRQLASPGSLVVDYTPRKYKRVSVQGAVNVEYTQFGSAFDAQPMYAIVDQILAPLLTGHRNLSPLSGEVSRV